MERLYVQGNTLIIPLHNKKWQCNHDAGGVIGVQLSTSGISLVGREEYRTCVRIYAQAAFTISWHASVTINDGDIAHNADAVETGFTYYTISTSDAGATWTVYKSRTSLYQGPVASPGGASSGYVAAVLIPDDLIDGGQEALDFQAATPATHTIAALTIPGGAIYRIDFCGTVEWSEWASGDTGNITLRVLDEAEALEPSPTFLQIFDGGVNHPPIAWVNDKAGARSVSSGYGGLAISGDDASLIATLLEGFAILDLRALPDTTNYQVWLRLSGTSALATSVYLYNYFHMTAALLPNPA